MGSSNNNTIQSFFDNLVTQMSEKSPSWTPLPKAAGSSQSTIVEKTITQDTISISHTPHHMTDLLSTDIKDIVLEPETWPEYVQNRALREAWKNVCNVQVDGTVRREPDGGNEEPLHTFVQQIFRSLISMVLLLILQVWHNAQATDSPEFPRALEYLASLEVQSRKKYNYRKNDITPDFTLTGLIDPGENGIDPEVPIDSGSRSPLATLEMKAVGLVEKQYSKQSPSTGRNKDQYISKLVDGEGTLAEANRSLPGLFGPRSWPHQALEVLGQVSNVLFTHSQF